METKSSRGIAPVKIIYFLIEGANSLTTCFFFSYLMFWFRDHFHFGNRENLAIGALHGLFYIVGSWYGGKYGQKKGYLNAMRTGFFIMAAGLLIAWFVPTLAGQLFGLIIWTLGVSLTWPSLEALVSTGENDVSLPKLIGIYNLVWAGLAGIGYFIGGAIFEYLGAGSLYWFPLAVLSVQIIIVTRLIQKNGSLGTPLANSSPSPAPHHPETAAFNQPIPPETFLKMAWLANPFAYMAINTVLLIIPDLARRFELSPTLSGIFCSVWLFTRLGAFAVLWKWTGWHYRFRWLLFSFIALVVGFMLLLLANSLWLLLLAQILFGAATGLIYYSSLFYSMDVGETKGEHGGLHEAAIGVGICAGPAVGATSLHLLPKSPNISTWAVGIILCCGLASLIWYRQHNSSRPRE